MSKLARLPPVSQVKTGWDTVTNSRVWMREQGWAVKTTIVSAGTGAVENTKTECYSITICSLPQTLTISN